MQGSSDRASGRSRSLNLVKSSIDLRRIVMEESVLRREIAAPFADLRILAEHLRKSLEFLQRKLQNAKAHGEAKCLRLKF